MRLAAAILILLVGAPVLAGPQEALAAAVVDARRLPQDVAYRTLYLSLDNYPDPEERQEFLRVLRGWIPHVCTEPDLPTIRVIGDGTVLALDREECGWLQKTQDAMGDFEFVWHRWERHVPHDGYTYRAAPYRVDAKMVKELEQRTYSRCPIARADFFLFYSSRQLNLQNKANHGFGYLDWLQLKTKADVEKLAGLDRGKSIKLGKELRALIEQGRSGVVMLDREIQWFASYGDGSFGTWITLDTFSNDGNKVTENLQKGTFHHDAEEWVFGLPNEMVGMWLQDAKGTKQDSVPDKLGGQLTPLRVGQDPRAHVGLCFHCHREGFLQDADDWARRSLRSPNSLDVSDYKEFLRLKRQLFGNLDKQIVKGRARYNARLKEACGLESSEFSRLHAKWFYKYQYQERGPARLAVELGTTEEQLVRSLKRAFVKDGTGMSAEERKRLAGLLPLKDKEPGTLGITAFEAYYQSLQGIVEAYP